MNINVVEKIKELLAESGISYSCFRHAPCRTSAESAEIRRAAGYSDVTGAKALLMKLYFAEGADDRFALFVLDGTLRLNSKSLKSQIEGLKNTRFSTAEELSELAGVEPGALPPFGEQIFAGISDVYVDRGILQSRNVGFNAGDREVSIILSADDYMKAAKITAVLDFAA